MRERLPTIALAAALAALLATLVVGQRRVTELEQHEQDVAGEIVTLDAGGPLTAPGERALASAELHDGDHVVFELCSGDAMDPAIWGATPASVAIFFVGETEDLVDRRALDAAMLADARRAAAGDGSCVEIDRMHATTPGRFEVRVAWDGSPGFASVPMRARIIARPQLGPSDGNLVFLVLVLSILVAMSGYLRVAKAPASHDEPGLAGGRIATGVALALLVAYALPWVFPPTRAGSFAAALTIAAAQVSIALGLSRPERSERLAWGRNERPARAAVGFLVAVVAGVVLQIVASRLLAIVPSTGEAPIETFVALPSGMFSFALVAVVVPLAEELFFRGFLFGTIEAGASRARLVAAFFGAWLLFVAVHLPQTWGNWGGLSAICVAGLGFTALRATFRSTPVSALAHLVYNALLAGAAMQQALVGS